ncbi:Probable methyltransferase PMT27 [Linum perenne]
MAIGRPSRTGKRSSSSSSSYITTITTFLFITLCVLALWMLTSTSLQGPTQTAYLARKAATAMAASTGTVADVVLEPQNVGKKQSVFEDNPGDLPADAIKSDEINNQASAEEKDKHTQISEESTMTTAQSVNQQVIVEETTSKNNNEKREIELQPAEKEKSNSESEKIGNPDEPPPQNAGETKSFEEQQKRQRMEDAGIQNPVEENVNEKPENKVTEEDQDQRMQQQQKMHDAQKQQQSEMKMDVDAHRPESVDNVTTDVTTSPSSSEIPKESKDSKRTWSTQASESENQKERRKEDDDTKPEVAEWQLCNVTAGTDYIPCLDNEKALKKLRTTGHFEHRERHCPEDPPTCLVPLPSGYKRPILWPNSRDKIWYHNVPRTKLAEFKGHQNWVKVTGEFLTFPGGGTQFIHGALHYIDFLQMSVPKIGWGKHTRVILDVGCGVASFGGYIFERDVLAMSFAPKDEHEAQVQFALERGIPAISAVMGSKRLPFPSAVFDLIHCARCRVPWHKEGGLLLLELNRLLRPGGYFVWSATPVYQKLKDDVDIWQEMSALTVSMCWELVTIIGAAIYRKPTTNDCYDQRKKNEPPMCADDDDSNAAWSVPLQACMHRVPTDASIRGTQWPGEWPSRLQKPPYWLNSSQMGIYGKPAPQDFTTDYKHWKNVVNNTYMKGLGISWDGVRNVMDMRAVYGGFAAALKDMKVWVLNIVTVDSPDTLPIIYERGLFGIYHDWCESFSTYPRTYDLVHADHLLSKLKTRCKLVPVLAEVDRILRPGGKFIVRDESKTIQEVETILKSLHWEIKLSKDQEGILSAQKGDWRPETIAASS